jgi:hypothetical protein
LDFDSSRPPAAFEAPADSAGAAFAAMKPYPQSWDGCEPVTDALDRFGLRDLFDLAVQNGLRVEAVTLLVYVGVGESRASMIIERVLRNVEE